jgi:hypothetical protein
MISENNKRIRSGDSIYVWSEQNTIGYGKINFLDTNTNIIIKNYQHNKGFQIAPIYEDHMPGLIRLKKIKNDRATHSSIGWIGFFINVRWGDNQLIDTAEISWYELNQSFNIE